jgi:hypothetical protein
MNSLRTTLLVCLLLPAAVWAKPPKTAALVAAKEPPPPAALMFRDLRYTGKVTDDEARFAVEVAAESLDSQEVSQTLFEGELALLPPKLPAPLRIERSGNQYRLFVSKPGQYQFKLELVAKIVRAEPWNQVSFKGPSAAIASVTAEAAGVDV